jgi:hypothetical protein
MKTETRLESTAPVDVPEREIVAIVLGDGTIRPVGEEMFGELISKHFTSGKLAGDGWTLWWERRAWS